MTMKTRRIVKAKLSADGKVRRIGPAGKSGRILRGKVKASLLDSPAAFAPDADSPPLTRRELHDLQPVAVNETPNLTELRQRLHMSQGAFATLFGIPLATLKDWEQGRRKPDAPARAYLRVIAQNPKAVRNALEAAE